MKELVVLNFEGVNSIYAGLLTEFIPQRPLLQIKKIVLSAFKHFEPSVEQTKIYLINDLDWSKDSGQKLERERAIPVAVTAFKNRPDIPATGCFNQSPIELELQNCILREANRSYGFLVLNTKQDAITYHDKSQWAMQSFVGSNEDLHIGSSRYVSRTLIVGADKRQLPAIISYDFAAFLFKKTIPQAYSDVRIQFI